MVFRFCGALQTSQNYQARIWRLALQSNPDYPSPIGHGWEIISDGDDPEKLGIKWMDCKPAPEEVSAFGYF